MNDDAESAELESGGGHAGGSGIGQGGIGARVGLVCRIDQDKRPGGDQVEAVRERQEDLMGSGFADRAAITIAGDGERGEEGVIGREPLVGGTDHLEIQGCIEGAMDLDGHGQVMTVRELDGLDLRRGR